MVDYKLTYFDLAGSRGEEIRLAFAIAGVAFEDIRLKGEAFRALKPGLPFGALPTLEVKGKGVFAQTNSILRLIGQAHGLHPTEPYEAARHDAMMDAVEDLRNRISLNLHSDDAAQKKAARQDLATDYLPKWAAFMEKLIGTGPFVGGGDPNVADIKIFMVDRWLSGGVLDGIPKEIFDPFPKIKRVAGAVKNLPPAIKWFAQTR